MKTTEQTFDLAAGIAVQKDDLAIWKTVLSEEMYSNLCAHCVDQNKALVDIENNNGYSVFRGQQFYEYVINCAMKIERNNRKNAHH